MPTLLDNNTIVVAKKKVGVAGTDYADYGVCGSYKQPVARWVEAPICQPFDTESEREIERERLHQTFKLRQGQMQTRITVVDNPTPPSSSPL